MKTNTMETNNELEQEPVIKSKRGPVNQKLEDIEEGVFKNKCFNCGRRQTKLVLVLEGNRRTKNYIGHCPNTQCFRNFDLTKTPSWVVA